MAGLVVLPLFGFAYLKFGAVPVAVTDPAFPYEKAIVHIPLNARIKREMPASSPVAPSPEVLASGAVVYRQQCAMCHGLPGHTAEIANHIYPPAPQLWASHRPGVVGVSDDPVGETYWKVKNGIRLAGMPAYASLLNEQQMWAVSLLLSQAADPLSQAVRGQLTAR